MKNATEISIFFRASRVRVAALPKKVPLPWHSSAVKTNWEVPSIYYNFNIFFASSCLNLIVQGAGASLSGLWPGMLILGPPERQKISKFSQQAVIWNMFFFSLYCCYLTAGFCPNTRVADNILLFRAVLGMSLKILKRQICWKIYIKQVHEIILMKSTPGICETKLFCECSSVNSGFSHSVT